MATLEKIRSKAGLLVIVVGLALFAFIIGDFLRSGSTFFRQSKEKIANIDGKTIGIREYQAKISEMEEVYKLQSNATSVPEDIMTQIRESVFQSLVRQIILGKESDQIGFTVSKEELSDLIMGNNISPMIQQMPMFRNQQTGTFDKNMLIQFLKVIESDDLSTYPLDQQEQLLSYKKFWMFWEQNIKDQKMEEKFSNLISKAVVTNSLDAKASFDANKISVDFDYVVRPYSSIPDDQITIADSEIKKLYNARKDQFKQDEAQVISFIAVNIVPSKDDFDKVLNQLEEIKPAFTAADDNISEIVNDNSDVPFTNAYQSLSMVPANLADFTSTANIGDVAGPVLNEDVYVMAKLLDKKVDVDSIKVSQIMLPSLPDAELMHLADSLVAVVNGGTPFADMARQMTNGQSDGNMGWATETSLLINADEKFKNGVFEAPLNKAVIIKSSHGTHIVQIMERTSPVTKYKLANVQIKVTPSSQTFKKLYSDLSHYIASNNSLDSFQLAASGSGYYCQRGVMVTKSEQNLQGVGKSRPVIRWAFEHKKGAVSDIFECDNKFVVAAVEKSMKKGISPYEDVADRLKRELLNDKKAEMIIAETKSKPRTSIDQYAMDFNGTVQNVKFVTFGTGSISGVGQEPVLNANAVLADVGKVTGPLKGKAGIYFINVTDKKDGEGQFDLNMQKQSMDAANSYRVGYQVLPTLIQSSDIEDNRITFY